MAAASWTDRIAVLFGGRARRPPAAPGGKEALADCVEELERDIRRTQDQCATIRAGLEPLLKAGSRAIAAQNLAYVHAREVHLQRAYAILLAVQKSQDMLQEARFNKASATAMKLVARELEQAAGQVTHEDVEDTQEQLDELGRHVRDMTRQLARKNGPSVEVNNAELEAELDALAVAAPGTRRVGPAAQVYRDDDDEEEAPIHG